MITFSALYYTGSIEKKDLIIRDNRFYPGKYVETFYIWYQYFRKNYPNENLVLFVDGHSPIDIQPLLDWLPEKYKTIQTRKFELDPDYKIYIRQLEKHSSKYFWAMQRNLVEGILTAYEMNENMFWLDNDAFLNTNITPLINGVDFASSSIEPYQLTAGSICFYVSKKRLHELDSIGVNLPDYMDNLLDNGPQEVRMHAFQEGGIYKTFCYGKAIDIPYINMSHLSCYENFLIFLKNNRLETDEYKKFFNNLNSIDISKMNGVEMKFLDAFHTEKYGSILNA